MGWRERARERVTSTDIYTVNIQCVCSLFCAHFLIVHNAVATISNNVEQIVHTHRDTHTHTQGMRERAKWNVSCLGSIIILRPICVNIQAMVTCQTQQKSTYYTMLHNVLFGVVVAVVVVAVVVRLLTGTFHNLFELKKWISIRIFYASSSQPHHIHPMEMGDTKIAWMVHIWSVWCRIYTHKIKAIPKNHTLTHTSWRMYFEGERKRWRYKLTSNFVHRCYPCVW